MASGTIWLSSDIGTLEGKIEWSSYSNGSSANSSTVTANLYIARTDWYTTKGTWGWGLTVGDSSDSGNWYGSVTGDWILLKTITNNNVKHNNDGSGNCWISGYANGPSGTSMDGHGVSGNQTVALDNIPRYAKITKFVVQSSSLNSLTINWNADSTIDWLQYSLNGAAWTNTSGLTFSISNLYPNTKYSVKIRVRRKDSGLWTESSVLYGTTKDISKITNAPNFNFGNNTSITITNPSGEVTSLKIKCGETEILSKNLSTGLNSIQFTQAQLDVMYKKYTDTNNITLQYIVTTKNTYTNTANVICSLTGNVKTFRLYKNESLYRCKVYVKYNGVIKRGVVFTKFNNKIRRGV